MSTAPGIGHNSGDPTGGFDDEAEPAKDVGGIAADRLQSFIERIERLNEEKAALSADIREIFAEAKSHGFDTKIMRKVLALRKLEKSDREEEATLVDLYMRALGLE